MFRESSSALTRAKMSGQLETEQAEQAEQARPD